MADLRALCGEIGWSGVRSYIQSGNLVFQSDGPPGELARALEGAIEHRFGLAVPVIVRTAAEWRAFSGGNPFTDASRQEPNLVMLALSKSPPAPDAVTRLQERAAAGERVIRVGEVLWIHFAGGAARSRLSPVLLDRCVGSPVTTRNWRTVLALDELIAPGRDAG